MTQTSIDLVKFNHAEDHEYSTQLVRWFLKPIGTWPRSATTSMLEKVSSHCLIVLCFSLIVAPLIPSTMYILYEEEYIPIKMKAVGPSNYWLSAALKYLCLILHGQNIRGCLDHIKVDWHMLKNNNDREIMLNTAKRGRYIAALSVFLAHCGVFSYNVARWCTTTMISFANETIKVRLLPLPCYDGFIDARFSPQYEIVFAFQCCSTFVVNSITAGTYSLAAMFVMHACGQLKIIMTWIEHVVHKGDDYKREERIIVECHLRTLVFIGYIENVLNQICFVELIGSVLDICFLGYYFIIEIQANETANLVTYGIVFASIIFNIFIMCYIGEILTEQCQQIGETAYMAKWYRLPSKAALDFIIIISRSRCVTHISAGKLVQITLSTFGYVIKSALAYLNMLRHMTH